MFHATFSSRDANQHFGRLKRAADEGPVVISDRGHPAYVLMTHDEYERLQFTKPRKSIVDVLNDDRPEADFDFEFPRLADDTGLRVPGFGED